MKQKDISTSLSTGLPKEIIENIRQRGTIISNSKLTLPYRADPDIVSKLLGRADMRTTQVYAKIVNDGNRKSANLIQRI